MHCQACEGPIATCLMSHVQLADGDWVERTLASRDCKHCLVLKGNYHHADCIEEICPECEGKLHLCDCFPAELLLGAA